MSGSSFTEGLAVGALVHGRIGLMGAHQNVVQGAVVLGIAVVSAGLDGTLDALIGLAVHSSFLLCFGFLSSMSVSFADMRCFFGMDVVF